MNMSGGGHVDIDERLQGGIGPVACTWFALLPLPMRGRPEALEADKITKIAPVAAQRRASMHDNHIIDPYNRCDSDGEDIRSLRVHT